MEENNDEKFLISWIQSFPDFVDCQDLNRFSDPQNLYIFLIKIHTSYFQNCLGDCVEGIEQFQTLWRNMKNYVASSLKKDFLSREPNFVSIIRRCNMSGICLMLKLALAITIIAPRRKQYIQQILDSCDIPTQNFLMHTISSMFIGIPLGSALALGDSRGQSSSNAAANEHDANNTHILRLEEECAFLTGQLDRLRGRYDSTMTIEPNPEESSSSQLTEDQRRHDQTAYRLQITQLKQDKAEMAEKIALLEEQLNEQIAVVTMMRQAATNLPQTGGFDFSSQETPGAGPSNRSSDAASARSNETNLNIIACQEKIKRLELESEIIMDSLVSYAKIRLSLTTISPSSSPQSWLGKKRESLGIF